MFYHQVSEEEANQHQSHHSSEVQQNPQLRRGSGENDSSDIPLTELHAPSPSDLENRSNTFENTQRQQFISSRSHGSQGPRARTNSLTEVTAPSPISSCQASAASRPRSSQDEENLEDKRESGHDIKSRSVNINWTNEIFTISWLILFSFFGTLARLGVEAITLYPNSPLPSRVIWANLGGSFVMGFLLEDRRLFQEEWGNPDPDAPPENHGKVKKTLPLYIGLATGFCGSFTSYSSYMRDAFLALTNALEGPSPTTPYHSNPVVNPRNGGFSFLALLAILIVHPAVSIAALQVGVQTASALQPVVPVIPFRIGQRILNPIGVILALGCWIGVVFLAIFPPGNDIHWRFRATLPLVFAPLGCLLRFYLAKYLNARLPTFPLGTFVANIFGTAVLGMAWDLQHSRSIAALPVGSPNVCALLEGIMEGFCGCLTTVSTWVVELGALRRGHAWIYGTTSVGVGLGIMVVIMGSMGWTIGFSTPRCN